MKATDIPVKFPIPFADSGQKNAIPTPSQIGTTKGAASLTDGFPPVTMTDLSAGGQPPDGYDVNGILNMISAATRWNDAGGFYPYDSAFSTAIGGYPKGAVLLNSTGDGFWLSTSDDNTTDPSSNTSGKWVPINNAGTATISLAGSNVTLTPAQYEKRVLVLTGSLTANVQLTFPKIAGTWTIENQTTGGYTVSALTSGGTVIALAPSGPSAIYCDGTNMLWQIPFATNTQSLAGTATNVAANPAGVAAYVGQSGLGKSANQALPASGTVSLDDYYVDGHFRFRAATYTAAGGTQNLDAFKDGQLAVFNASGQDTTLQIISGYGNGEVMWRSFINANGTNPNAASHPFKVVWDSNNFNPADYLPLHGKADTAGTADNSNQLQGNPASAFANNGLSNVSNLTIGDKYGGALSAGGAATVGSAIFAETTGAVVGPGGTIAGSSLIYSSHAGRGGAVNVGTWMSTGYANGVSAPTTFIRIY